MSRVYLVVSAVQIFEWMTRTPELKLIRGASAALRTETSKETITKVFPELRWCDAAGDVDGVVAIEFPGTGTIEAAAHWANRLVGEHLATVLPAVVWEAWWAESEFGYLDAYENFERAKRGGFADSGDVGTATFLPRASELPLAESCAGCRREPAYPAHSHDQGRLGFDCQARKEAGKWIPSKTQAWTFNDLAKKGGLSAAERSLPGRHRSRNHLATIHADGNGVGALMSRLAQGERLADLRSEIIMRLDAATRGAYETANTAIGRGAQYEGSIRHFCGGDDLLVTVAAPQAWDFVMVLASTFERRMADLLGNYEQELQRVGIPTNAVSLGIGMTFAHASHPVADARDLAFKAMKQAKDRVGGSCSAVSWLDLTAEDGAPKSRYIRLNALLAERRGTNPVAALTPSARATLSEILNHFRPPKDRADDQRVVARARADAEAEVDRWSTRTGNHVEFNGLEDNLSRARWWPKTPIPDELRAQEVML